MAKETAAELFIGTDHQFVFHILNDDEDAAIDITGWTLSWMVKKSLAHLDAAALLTKTTVSGITIAGVYSATPGSNLQRATVAIADTDTDAFTAGDRFYELKRMDAGADTILAYGTLTVKRGVHRT
jgi:hypothetical protein